MASSSTSTDSFSKEELDLIQEQRDTFQNEKDGIHDLVIELQKFTINRYSNWRLSLANISFALAVAIFPLMFFSGKRPAHAVTFYIGVSLLLLNGFIAYVREKHDIERDFNGLGRVGKPEILKTTEFVNLLNKALFYRTKDSYKKYFDLSRDYANKSETEISERAEESKKINLWNEFHLILPILATYLIAWEIVSIRLNGFLLGLAILVTAAFVYTKLEYKKAKKSVDEAKNWDIKIAAERMEFNRWWQDRFNRKG